MSRNRRYQFLCLMKAIILVSLVSGCGSPNHVRESQTEEALKAEVFVKTPAVETASMQSPKTVALTSNDIIYFPAGKTVIDELDKEKLRLHAARLKQNRRDVLTLHAYNDNRGSRAYNLAIAEKCSGSIVRALCAMGVQRKQIRTRLSSAQNTADNICPTKDCPSKGRRIELVYKP